MIQHLIFIEVISHVQRSRVIKELLKLAMSIQNSVSELAHSHLAEKFCNKIGMGSYAVITLPKYFYLWCLPYMLHEDKYFSGLLHSGVYRCRGLSKTFSVFQIFKFEQVLEKEQLLNCLKHFKDICSAQIQVQFDCRNRHTQSKIFI